MTNLTNEESAILAIHADKQECFAQTGNIVHTQLAHAPADNVSLEPAALAAILPRVSSSGRAIVVFEQSMQPVR